MSVAAAPRPFTFAGFPVASWGFAIRIWLAVVAALYASFWLQLEAASSSAITAAILALPTRGQALEKAGFRLMATVIGVAASILIVGLFSQATDLLLLAFAAWLGLSIYAAGLYDGNRAYAAILSGYTVALVAIQHTDMPQQVFESGLARGAAIVIGIVAIAVVNDLLVAPDRHPGLLNQLAGLHRQIRDRARAVANGGAVDDAATAALMREIAILRSDLTSLVAERAGRAGSAAARSAAVAMVAEFHATRALSVLPLAAAAGLRARLLAGLDGAGAALPVPEPSAPAGKDLANSALTWAVAEVLRRDRDVREALAALQSGRRPAQTWRAPRYRCHRIAAAMGLRAGIWMALAATVFVVAGWPATDGALSLVAVLIGLGAITPDPRAFTTVALVAMPIASLLTGILEFLILDGVTAFPLLAIALAPFVIGTTLLMTLRNPLLSAMGRLNLIFILAILGPTNPPSYDPQNFLFLSLFSTLAAGLLLAAQHLVPPVSAGQRLRWLIRSARRELMRLPARARARVAPEDALFRDALRIAQLPRDSAAETEALGLFDLAGVLRGARQTLAGRDARQLRDDARRLHETARGNSHGAATAAALFIASRMRERTA